MYISPFTKSAQHKTTLKLTALSVMVAALSGCGTLTGLPSHGGGKRFAVEQKLVAASMRASLKQLDVTPLKGKRVHIEYQFIADEGGGQIVGGRASFSALFSSTAFSSPVTSTNSTFQVFDTLNRSNAVQLANTVSNGTGASTSSGTLSSNESAVSSGSRTNTDTMTGNATTNTTTNIGESKSNQTATSTGTNSTEPVKVTSVLGAVTTTTNNSAVTSTSSTPAYDIVTTQNFPITTTTTKTGTVETTQTTAANDVTSTQKMPVIATTTTTNPSSITQSTPSLTNTQTTDKVTGTQGSTSTSNVTNQASVNTQLATTTNGSTTKSDGTSQNKEDTTTTQSTTGKQNSQNSQTQDSNSKENREGMQQVVQVAGQTTQTKGYARKSEASVNYQGLGDYQTLSVPKSDASFFSAQMHNYLMLSGVQESPLAQADTILYVSVDVFGLNRSRTDVFVYNNEKLTSETAIELLAVDRRTGLPVMPAQTVNMEATYKEHYLFWVGPISTEKMVKKGDGLLVDFSDVDGKHKSYPAIMKRTSLDGKVSPNPIVE